MALFILTWNPDKWAVDWDGEVDRWLEGEVIETGWSTGNRKSGIERGDLGILLRQGRERGVLALGRFTGDFEIARHWGDGGAKASYANIQFHELVDVEDRLPTERLLDEIPDVKWNSLYSSGIQVSPQHEEEVLDLWHEHWSSVRGVRPLRAPDHTEPSDSLEEADYVGYLDMLETFADAGLAAPPIPDALRPQLRRRGSWCWSTREINPLWMYGFGAYISEAVAGDCPEYVAISHAGHGVNSYGLNYHLVHGPTAIFTQDRWGGMYSDPVAARIQVASTFSRTYGFLESLPVENESDDFPRIFVVWSHFRGVCEGGLQLSLGEDLEFVEAEDQPALFELAAAWALGGGGPR